MNFLDQVKKTNIIAVVRTKNTDQAIQAVVELIKGGIKGTELTYQISNAGRAIKNSVAKYQADPSVIIGASTILTAGQTEDAIHNGAISDIHSI